MSIYTNSRFSLFFFFFFFISLSLLSAQNTLISRFQQYLRINTAHPNPNYAAAVAYLTSQSHSIPNLRSQILHLASPHKPLLLLTLPGTNPNLPSVLFNSHLDSVPAEPSKWTHDPFAAVRTSDGKIYARGAQDDKCIGIQYLEAIKNLLNSDSEFKPIRTIHVLYVPDEEIGGFDGMAKFVESKEFEELNVGFVMDEGQASTNDDFRVFYADRTPWHLVIKACGMPGHGSRMYDNSAMENLMKSVEVISKFRENQFDVVKAGWAMNSEVISVNPVYLKAGIPSPTGFVMNMQPSEAEAGFDVRLPPTTDPILLKKIIVEEWAPATRNMTYELTEKGPLRDLQGRPLSTVTNASNPWWTAFEQAISAIGAKISKPEILASTTDARFMRQRGIPTLGFSPMKNTPILLHDHDEFLKDTVYLEGIKVYESIIKALSSLDIQIPSGHESALPKAEDGIRSMLAKGLVLCKSVVNKAKSLHEMRQIASKASEKVASFNEKAGFTELVSRSASIISKKVHDVEQNFQVSEKAKSAFAIAQEKVGSAGSVVTQKVQKVDQSFQVSAKAISAFAIAEEKVGSAGSMISEKVREVDQKLQVSEKVKSAFSVAEEKMGVAGSMVNEKVREVDEKLQFSEKVKSAFAVAKEKVGSAGSMVSDKIREGDQKIQVSEKFKSAFVDAGEKVGIAGSVIMKNEYVSEGVGWVMGVFKKATKAGGVEDEQRKMVDKI